MLYISVRASSSSDTCVLPVSVTQNLFIYIINNCVLGAWVNFCSHQPVFSFGRGGGTWNSHNTE